MAGREALGRIAAILATPAPAPPATSIAPPTSHAFTFAGVHYAYAAGARPALRGVDLAVAEGQTVALVGPNGAGKSTLASLLLGFARPDAGSIQIGGVALDARLAGAQQTQACLRGLNLAATGLLSQLAAVAVLLLAVPLTRGGQLDGVFLAMLALTAVASFEAVAPLAVAAQGAEVSLAAAARLFAIADTPPQVQGEPTASPEPLDAGLEISGLSFCYPGVERPALCNVSVRVAPGERLVVVGPSGAGKSTLVSLLLRFWEGYTGTIRIGGHDLRAYRAEDVRRLFGVVAQQTHLFHGTVRENLLLARPDATEAELDAACRRACFDTVLARLPEGYDAWIGEQGAALSGGERQRLAIARALLKDAPTSRRFGRS
jgi:ABC-type multidrug transport system fused ATPase/permease subunit